MFGCKKTTTPCVYITIAACLACALFLLDARMTDKVSAQSSLPLRQQIIQIADMEPARMVTALESTLDTYNGGLVTSLTNAVNGHAWSSSTEKATFVDELKTALAISTVGQSEFNAKFIAILKQNLDLDAFSDVGLKVEELRRIRELMIDNFTNGSAVFDAAKETLIPKP